MGQGGGREQRGPREPRDSKQQGGGPEGQSGRPGHDEGGASEIVVKIGRCATVVKGGRRFSFGALVVMGDRKSSVGMGYGKSGEVPSAVDKAKKFALRRMISVPLVGGTIPHRVIGRYGASRVVMVPASPGTGVIAGASVRAVLELAGIHDVLTKSYGSNTPKNLVRATLEGLGRLVTRDSIERLRGVKLEITEKEAKKDAIVAKA
ncbi:MAG: 30S ribosomal protein S5 [Planctomycetes bacterium]|nr:30S ribosomal protein S5 [Planctomycetota bacterium]MBI3836023.1 30S ribosomal protein S5 [Planctomycetota bacterium]